MKLFVACFEYAKEDDASASDEDMEGSFEIVVEAADRHGALSACKRRLDQLADEPAPPLGAARVFLLALVEISRQDVANGVVLNQREEDFIDFVPDQQLQGTLVHHDDDFPELVEPLPDEPPGEGHKALPFWDGVAAFNAKWKLFWCTTEDHDEDWFVIARNALEAEQFHVAAEGYDDDDASAELVCILPPSEQNIDSPRWPSEHDLEACGAEFLPNVPQDGANALRHQMGSGARVVQIAGRTFAEGDIVANTSRRSGNDRGS